MRCVPLIFPEVLIHQLQPRHGSTLATLDVISKDHVTPLILFDLRCALRSCRLGDVISTSRNFPAGLTDIFDIIYIYIFDYIWKKCGCEDAFPFRLDSHWDTFFVSMLYPRCKVSVVFSFNGERFFFFGGGDVRGYCTMAQIAKWAWGLKESLILAGELVSEEDWMQDMLFVTVTIWNPLI